MVIKLDMKDKKILALLDENARLSNTQIGKRIRLSKPAVEYRLKRFDKNKVIFAFYPLINFTRLGYSQYKIYFKLQNASLDDEKRMVDFWTESRNSVWVAQIRGRWDLTVSLLAKSNFEFGKILSQFMDKFSQFVLEKDVLLTEYSPMYRKGQPTGKPSTEFVYGIPEKIYEIDETDTKILRTLSKNARMPIIELAKKTGLTRDIINYRMKKLIKNKLIIQFRCYPNLANIGISFYKIILRTKNLNEETERKLRQYVSQHRKMPQLLKLIGSWDIEIETEVEDEEELYKFLNEIRKEFSDIIRDFDVIKITKSYKYDFFPF